jgi:phosphopantetheinyl transferase (holo-ACP synthase)
MTKKLTIAMLLPVLFAITASGRASAQDFDDNDAAVEEAVLSEAEMLQLERLRAYWHRKAERDAEREARIKAFRQRQQVQRELQVEQMQLMYHHNILAQQQMMMHYQNMNQIAAMQQMANRPHVHTSVVNPHLEIMQGRLNQKINTSQSNTFGNFVNLRSR